MQRPIISIVTVVYNANPQIEATIQSVLSNKEDGVEYIVIDGGSTDGTVGILEKYRDQIDILISERDKGIYDAMNKALAVCRSKYVLNINTGDLLLAPPLELLGNSINGKDYDMILLNVRLSNGMVVKSRKSFVSKLANTFHHQGVLYKVDKDLRYDLAYRVYADFDMNQRIIRKRSLSILNLDKIICYHDISGISHNKKHFHENYKIVRNNYGMAYLILSYLYYKYRGIKQRLKLS